MMGLIYNSGSIKMLTVSRNEFNILSLTINFEMKVIIKEKINNR